MRIKKTLAKRFRRCITERYGLRRDSLSKAVTDLIEEELGATQSLASDNVNALDALS
ncbi:MAG: hypothetical protein QXP80_05505 [Zestosphaera sp.]